MNTDNREKSWLAEKMEDPEFRVSFAQEMAGLRFAEQITDALEARKVRRSDLAAKLHRSRAWVTQALQRGRNLTIKTMVELADALGMEVDIVVRPRRGASKDASLEPDIASSSTVVTQNDCDRWHWVRTQQGSSCSLLADHWYRDRDESEVFSTTLVVDLRAAMTDLRGWGLEDVPLMREPAARAKEKALISSSVVALSS